MVSAGLEDPSPPWICQKQQKLDLNAITTWSHRVLLETTPNLKINQSSSKFQ